jgi:hypothetical protein
MQDSLPQSVRKLLGVLEDVEKVVANSKSKEKATKENAEKTTGKGKCKGSISNENQIPKKARVTKSCALCQRHGFVHTTHNTGECCKYEKDGTLRKDFSRKAAVGQKRHGSGKKENSNSFAQIMERFSKLEISLKKTKTSS